MRRASSRVSSFARWHGGRASTDFHSGVSRSHGRITFSLRAMLQRSTLTRMIDCLLGINQKEVGRLRLAARRLVTTSRREIATIAAALLLGDGTLTADEIVGVACV